MSDTFVAEQPSAPDQSQDAAESQRYEDAGKRFEAEEPSESEQGEEKPEPNWREEAEKADKRFQDQQRAMKAERKRRQELERKLEEYSKSSKGDEKPSISIRDPNEDPIGAVEDVRKLIEAEYAARQAAEEQESQTRQVSQREQRLASTLQEAETDFRRTKPDYDKAVEYFKKARAEELIDSGVPKADLNKVLRKEFLELIERADNSDNDPAEVVYKLALRRGYSIDAGRDKLQTIADGQKAGQSLSRVAGRSGDGSEMTFARASTLKGPALKEAYAKLRAQAKRNGTFA